MRAAKIYNEKLRQEPSVPKRTYTTERKKHLKGYIPAALDYYYNEFSRIAHKGNRSRCIKSLGYFEHLMYWYRGFSIAEIAFRTRCSESTAQSAIKQAEGRVERYVKMKERIHEKANL